MDGSGFSFPGLRVVLCFACLIGFGKNGKNRQFLGTLWDVWNQISWVISRFPRGLCDWAAFNSEFCCFLFHPWASSPCALVTDPCISAIPLVFVGGLGSSRRENLQKGTKSAMSPRVRAVSNFCLGDRWGKPSCNGSPCLRGAEFRTAQRSDPPSHCC